jgi:DNA-binding NarL/FixJ family response regulator
MSIWNVGLTKGDRDVLRCIADGVDRVPAIAERLELEEDQIRRHLNELLYRLRLASLSELAALVRQSPPPL